MSEPLAVRIERAIADKVATPLEVEALGALNNFAWSVTEAHRLMNGMQAQIKELREFISESTNTLRFIQGSLESQQKCDPTK